MTAGRRRNLSLVTPPEVARQREEAFQSWLSSTETAYLECRNGGHIIPGITDDRSDAKIVQGVCLTEAACVRCGITFKKQIGIRDGFLVGGGRASYDYSSAPGYLLPREATGPGGSAMDRTHRGEVRLELLERAMRKRGTTLRKEVARAKRRKGDPPAKFSGK
jgi:hypothetical protein